MRYDKIKLGLQNNEQPDLFKKIQTAVGSDRFKTLLKQTTWISL